jgi:hypothetical protein
MTPERESGCKGLGRYAALMFSMKVINFNVHKNKMYLYLLLLNPKPGLIQTHMAQRLPLWVEAGLKRVGMRCAKCSEEHFFLLSHLGLEPVTSG